ncbi:DMT family transporter [Elizabethkingia ursingii]|uniref:EamA family transporter n=1 Tax=Elizabethkingia ursingii TaxID=1756150 RepID=UPI00201283D5|nr:DMT family transporter [Elizabethkingia ursingii]MCL1668553.1 DMT family transporter [Elizabethkingia ursingii]
MIKKINQHSLGIYMVVLAMICVQSGTAIAKFLFPVLGPAGTVSLRLGIASLLLLVIFKIKIFGRSKFDYYWCLSYGVCLAGMNLSFYYAIKFIPMALGTTIEFTGPLALAIILSRKYQDFIWAGLASLGIALITPWSNTNSINIIGILLAALAGIFWVGYILCGKIISQKMESIDAVTLGMGVAFLIVLPLGLNDGFVEKLNIKWLLLGACVALLSSAIPFSLDMRAFNKLSSKTYSILMSLHPALAALSGFIFLGEHLNLIQILAILSVIIASIGSAITSKR